MYLSKTELFEVELFWYLNCILKLYWNIWNGTVYMYKMDLTLNNSQWLICHKIKPNRLMIIMSVDVTAVGRWDEVWNAIDSLSIIWIPEPSEKIKQDFFQAVAVYILLYGWTTWMLTKHIRKDLDGSYIKILHVLSKNSCK